MADLNSERVLARTLSDLARDHGVAFSTLGEGWIIRLARQSTVRFVHGYAFDLNSAATHAIACDKCATSDLLHAAGVPRVEHRLFLHPDMAKFVPHPGNWPGMLAFFDACGSDVVVKDNTGTGGRGVYRARSRVELEAAVLDLFRRGHSVALSPFITISDETRLVMLAGECEAAYAKVRPTVVGDGTRTVLELLAARVGRDGVSAEMAKFLSNLDPEAASALADVPPRGVERLLNWRHNLGQGASLRLLDPGSALVRPLVDLARRAAAALNLEFGSIDVVTEPGAGASPRVLEVNSGVMMEALAGAPGGQDIARRVYARAFRRMMDL